PLDAGRAQHAVEVLTEALHAVRTRRLARGTVAAPVEAEHAVAWAVGALLGAPQRAVHAQRVGKCKDPATARHLVFELDAIHLRLQRALLPVVRSTPPARRNIPLF